MAYGQLFDVPDTKKVRFIVHTDCKNEADDQFTLVHILLTQKLDVRGIIGGHFDSSDRKDPDRHDTAQQSAEEVRRILDLMGCADAQTVLTGSDVALPDEQTPIDNAAVRFIIDEAMRDDARPLFIGMQGALTDLASALLIEPRICGRMTCIWIGGGDYPEGGWEFNLNGDVAAANVVFSSSMPLWQVPFSTYKQFDVSLAELQARVMPHGAIGRYLFEQMVALNAELAGMRWPHGETWCLGDEGVICALLQDLEIEDCYDLLPAPRVGADLRYGPGSSERPVRVYRRMDARLDLEDLYAKLQIGWPSA